MTDASVASAAPEAATGGGAPETSSSSTASQTVDYSSLSDDKILEDAFAPKESSTEETPADEEGDEPKPPEAKQSDDKQKKDQPEQTQDEEEDVNPDREPEPENLKRAFKAHPELRKAFYREKEFTKIFNTPAEAREMRELFPTMEYAKAALSQAKVLLDADALYTNDPTQFAQRLQSGNPEAFFTFLSKSRNVAYQASPEGYRNSVAVPVARDLIDNLKDIASDSNDEDLGIAIQVLEDRLGWQASEKRPRISDDDPRIQELNRLKAEQSSRGQEAFTNFSRSADRSVVDGILKMISDSIGTPEGMPKKVIDSVTRETVGDVWNTLKANPHALSTYESLKRQGNLSPEHANQVTQFLLGHAKQIAAGKLRARMSEWTKEIVGANVALREKLKSAPNNKDVGASGGAPSGGRGKYSRGNIDYRKVSDDDIINS